MTGKPGFVPALAFALIAAHVQAQDSYRFDMGAKGGPVAKGNVAVHGDDAYDAKRGYGWETKDQKGFQALAPGWDFQTPTMKVGRGITLEAPLLYNQFADALTADGVAGKDMTFRLDVKPGRYRVEALVGDLARPLESLAIDAQGKTVIKDLAAKHYIWRNMSLGLGFFREVRFDVEAPDGVIRLRFHGDDSRFRTVKEEYDRRYPYDEHMQRKFQAKSYAMGDPNPFRDRENDIGGPYEGSAVLGLRVYPAEEPPFAWKGSEIVATPGKWKDAPQFVKLANDRRFEDAAKRLAAAGGDADPLTLATGYLFLAGHPDSLGIHEEAWLKSAREWLDKSPDNGERFELLAGLQYFEKGRTHFIRRGMGVEKDPVTARLSYESHFLQLMRCIALMKQINPVEPLYWKAQLYEMRSYFMLDPHQWVFASGEGFKILKRLGEAWPENKYFVFFKDDKRQWKPDEEWTLPDHSRDIDMAGAPEWAAKLRESYLLLLEMTEWWHDNKLQPDGGIGGGWGDDVELLSLWAIYGVLDPGASPKTLEVARRGLQGLWDSGEVDSEAGFVSIFTDAEHAAEWTGNTFNLALYVDYGNPLWLERAMKTARIMRGLFMGYTKEGRLHFKGNYFNALRIGTGNNANDSYINFRLTRPAAAVQWYSGHPEIRRLFVEWADAWRADAMSDARGKPVGVIPTEVGWPENVIGGVGGPNWYTPVKAPGSVNENFADLGYRSYIVQLLEMAHRMTGDAKFLEPMRLEAELVKKFPPVEGKEPASGTAEWVARVLAGTPEKGSYKAVEVWDRIQKDLATPEGSTTGYKPGEIVKMSDNVIETVKKHWPRLTTETSATDRVGFGGMAHPFLFMGGGSMSPNVIENLAATYDGLGRNAVCRVDQSNAKSLKIVFYNFNPGPLDVGVALWRLEPRAKYSMKLGPDKDNDGVAEAAARTEEFTLANRADAVQISLAPKGSTVLEFQQRASGQDSNPLPDMAVTADDIRYGTRWRQIEATIHNVGAAAARDFDVVFSTVPPRGEPKELGRINISFLDWPQDLDVKTIRVGLQYVPEEASVRYRVDIDPDKRIGEITERNNRAEKTIEIDPRTLEGRIPPDNY